MRDNPTFAEIGINAPLPLKGGKKRKKNIYGLGKEAVIAFRKAKQPHIIMTQKGIKFSIEIRNLSHQTVQMRYFLKKRHYDDLSRNTAALN